jgi:hypothetical protein
MAAFFSRATCWGPSRPAQIEADLAGVVELKILVDFGADLDIGDHLILAEAKLLK